MCTLMRSGECTFFFPWCKTEYNPADCNEWVPCNIRRYQCYTVIKTVHKDDLTVFKIFGYSLLCMSMILLGVCIQYAFAV